MTDTVWLVLPARRWSNHASMRCCRPCSQRGHTSPSQGTGNAPGLMSKAKVYPLLLMDVTSDATAVALKPMPAEARATRVTDIRTGRVAGMKQAAQSAQSHMQHQAAHTAAVMQPRATLQSQLQKRTLLARKCPHFAALGAPCHGADGLHLSCFEACLVCGVQDCIWHDNKQHPWLDISCIAAVISILQELQHKVGWLRVQLCRKQLGLCSHSPATKNCR